MKLNRYIALVMAAFVFSAVPAIAVAANQGKSSTAPGHNKSTPSTTSKGNSSTSSTKAYGKFCASENASKKHTTGQKGQTAFAQCVTALAKADKSARMSARAACKGLSKKHVQGSKGTAFSECVSAVEKMRHGHS